MILKCINQVFYLFSLSFSFVPYFFNTTKEKKMSNVPDYYSILEIPTDASHDDIREGKYANT
jgi:hypothetical protein